MENVEISAFLVLALCAIAGSMLGSVIWNMLLDRSYFSLERRVKSLENQSAGLAGIQKKSEIMSSQQAALAEVALIMQGEGTMQEKMPRLVAVAAKYPDALKPLLKLAKNQGFELPL